jgi:hypothetical protein
MSSVRPFRLACLLDDLVVRPLIQRGSVAIRERTATTLVTYSEVALVTSESRLAVD